MAEWREECLHRRIKPSKATWNMEQVATESPALVLFATQCVT